MLFDSIVSQVIKKTYSDTIQKATQARKDETLKRLEYYYDDQLSYLQAQLAKVYADSSKVCPVFINIVKKVINNISRAYSYTVKREVQGSARDSEIFKTIVESTALPRKIKQASRLTKLLKNTLIRPCWRNDHLDLDILDGSIVDVEWGDVPEDLKSVFITLYPQNGKREEIQYSLWTPEKYKLLDYMGNTIEDLINPYNVLPFVSCFDRAPSSEYWLEGGDDLITVQDAINERLSDLLYICRMQGFGQAYIKGFDKPGQDIYLGPSSVVQLPKDGELGFASTQAPITEIIESIKFIIGQLAISYGLSAHTLVSEPTQESGLSKIVSSQELDEIREDDKILWQGYEHQLFNLMRIVWNYHNPTQKISDKATLSIEFRDPKPQVDPYQQSSAWGNLESMGVISAVDCLMQLNPDIKTREQAMEHLHMVEAERMSLGGMPTMKDENGNPYP